MQINEIKNTPQSFNGNLSITVWNNFKPKTTYFKTKKWQDNLIKNDIIPHCGLGKYKVLTKSNTKYFNKIIEIITKKQLPKVSKTKVSCYEWNTLYIEDPEYKILNGTQISYEF